MPSLSEDKLLELLLGDLPLRPFPEDEYGNTYVFTIIDTFSRAVGLYAVPNLEARHAARMLVRHIGIFGCLYLIGAHISRRILSKS